MTLVSLTTILFLILALIIAAGIIALIVVFHIRNKRHIEYVLNNSSALKTLDEINHRYKFKRIKSFDMEHSYDNENFYDNISTEDYLTYQLVYKQKEVSKALKDTLVNVELFEKYANEIKDSCSLGDFEEVDNLNQKKLLKIEKKMFEEKIQTPVIKFEIRVVLILTNINGNYLTSKYADFNAGEIKTIIKKLNQKDGSFYTNREIWDAICRVERGKVTNKMRFAIMARDGYRCVKCGRPDSRAYLEIDHIIPIAKGGKSTYDNLQTLCHECNVKKGADIEY